MILKPFLSEQVRDGSQEKIKKIIEGLGGTMLNVDVWGKRHLAYKVDGHEEGYYIVSDVEIPADKLDDINREFGLMSNILRFMIIKE